MQNPVFDKYISHTGHHIEIGTYGKDEPINVAIECMDCYEVLTDEDREIPDATP